MSELRIGTRERELAMSTLDIHYAEGRLDADEYRERSAAAAAARHRSDLDVLFGDLPAPHPDYPGDRAAPNVTGSAESGGAAGSGPTHGPAGSGTPGEARRRDDPGSDRSDDLPELVAPLGAALGRNAGKLSALVPVAAVVLFVLSGFRFPVIFLLVPVALGILGYLGHRHGS